MFLRAVMLLTNLPSLRLVSRLRERQTDVLSISCLVYSCSIVGKQCKAYGMNVVLTVCVGRLLGDREDAYWRQKTGRRRIGPRGCCRRA
jgi:hypothetical protein